MSNYNSKHFRLFANCFPVKGIKRSLICDTQKNQVDFIPNDLFEILITHSSKSIEQIKEFYGEHNEITINEYLEFLFLKEYIFICDLDEIELFPVIDLSWEHPSLITNAIIDVGYTYEPNYVNIFRQLEGINCKDVQIRFFKPINIVSLIDIIQLFYGTKVKSIELYIPYSVDYDEKSIVELGKKFFRVHSIVIHSSHFNKIINDCRISPAIIRYTDNIITDHSHCGFISPKYFISNLNTFTESQNYNTCLNRKISIDVNGEIKNCPSMAKNYGNIKDTTLKEAIEKVGFKDVWYINKDQIEVCKDCEFRHICTDCRAYIKDPNNIYSKPAKCSYDPYTATWGEENPTNNPLYGQ